MAPPKPPPITTTRPADGPLASRLQPPTAVSSEAAPMAFNRLRREVNEF